MKKSLAKYFAVYQHLDLTAQSVEKLYVEALDDSQSNLNADKQQNI